MFYAQFNDDNICIGISNLSGEVDAPNMILLDSYDVSLIGKMYSNGEWLEVETEAQEEPFNIVETITANSTAIASLATAQQDMESTLYGALIDIVDLITGRGE